jgi:molecular chaperone DnaK (HSP70)
MSYRLGVDLGTTYTAAAVWRDGFCEMATLGNRDPTVPSVVFLSEDGGFLFGEAAARSGASNPSRVAREFKRRFGADSVPLFLGGTPMSADALLTVLLQWVIERVSEVEGEPPEHVVVCHPANWGPAKRQMFDDMLAASGIGSVSTITEPAAAALHYASRERLEPGQIVAVYDLGGGTFDASVLARTTDEFRLLGEPTGVESLGGMDVDVAVLEFVRSSLGGELDQLDGDDPETVKGLQRLREDCVSAKEALSSVTSVTIPVLLPNLHRDVYLTRPELEALIRPTLAPTVTALRNALSSADVTPQDLDKVLLVGGSSRIPLVGELLKAELGRPVAADSHPKHSIALGAARHAGAWTPQAAVTPLARSIDPAPRVEPRVEASPRRDRQPRSAAPLIARAPVIALVAVIVVALGVGGNRLIDTINSERSTTTTSSTTSTSTTATPPPPTLPARAFPGKGRALAPGLFKTTAFKPDFTVNVPSGWRQFKTEDNDVIDFTHDSHPSEDAVLTVARVERVFPDGSEFQKLDEARDDRNVSVAAPANLPQFLADRTGGTAKPSPGFAGGSVRATEIIGANPQTRNVSTGTQPLFVLVQLGDGRLFALVVGNENRLFVVDVAKQPQVTGPQWVLVAIEASPDQFNDFAARAEEFIATLRF